MPRKSGFTLIEVTLVLAITGALLAAVFAGQARLRATTQFGSSIDKLVNSINAVRNESLTTVTGGNGTTDANGQVIGERISFTHNSNVLGVSRLKLAPSGAVTTVPAYTVTLPASIKYDSGSPDTSVYFARTELTGELLTFISFPPAKTFPESPISNYIKDKSPWNTDTGKYQFSDGTRYACINIDPSNGAVTSQIKTSPGC